MQVNVYRSFDPPGSPWITVNAMQMTPWLSFDQEITTWGRTGYIQRFLLDGSIADLTGYLEEQATAGRVQITTGSNQELKIIEAIPIIEAGAIHCWLIHAVRQVHLIPPAPPLEPAGSLPIGGIVLWQGFTLPLAFLFCNGQEISRTGIGLALFSVLGTAFGVGDGSTTYNLPNYNEKFPRGTAPFGSPGDTRGSTGGTANNTLVIANLPPHGHQVPYSLNTGSSGTVRLGDAGTGGVFTTGLSNGASVPFSNEPPWLTTFYIIRYV